MGVRVGYLLVFRNPFEIAASLEERDGMSVDYGLTLWGSYQTDALRHTEGKSRLFVGFHQLLENSGRELTRISKFLETTWNPDAQSALEYEKKFLDSDLRHHQTKKGQPLEPVALQALALALDKVCQKSDKKELEDVGNAGEGALLGMMQVSNLIRKNNEMLHQSRNSVELFYSKNPGDFSEERKISKPCNEVSGSKENINTSLSGEVGLAPYWRLDPGSRPSIIHLVEMKFLDSKGHVVWDLQEHREQVLVQGTGVNLSLPPVGVELVSSGSDPSIILPALPGEALPVSSILIDIEFNSTQEELGKLVQMQAQKAADLLQALGEKDSQVAQMKSILDKNEMKIAPATKIDQQIEQIRQEMAAGREESKLVVKKVEEERATSEKQNVSLQNTLNQIRQEMAADREEGLKQLAATQQEAEVRITGKFESMKSSIEGRIVEMAQCTSEVHDSVVAVSSHPILRLFFWHAALSRIRKIKKPSWLQNDPSLSNSASRPGFWKRLERSIRKRRKRWIGGIGFDRDWYLEFYPDVAKAGEDPLYHFVEFGRKEGRHKNAQEKVSHEKGLWPTKIKKQNFLTQTNPIHKQKKEFDEHFYLKAYPDVKASKMDPWDHYKRHGYTEGRLLHAINYSHKASEVSMSVVIPTYNGQQKIPKTIEAISKFSHGMDIEIIIVNDGSSDQTESVVQAYSSKIKNIKLISTKQKGAGNARSAGAKVASKEILLFMGDDISPLGPEFFNAHWALHKTNPEINYSVLGKVEWPNDSFFPISPVMEHIQGPGGEQFGYSDMRPNVFWDWRFFYTCNVSLKRAVVSDWEAEGFHPSFIGCGFEDGEFAYRMSKKYGSFNIFYSDQSVGWHYHRHTFLTFFQRQALCGSQLTNFMKLHPECAGKTGVEEVLKILDKNNSNDPKLAYETLEGIKQINRFTLDLEARGLLGNDKWHKELLHASFRLAYFLGFLNSYAKPHQGYAEALTYIFKNAVRPLVPRLPASLVKP
jgi:glycosyltransferase involved in cell wall biosynthesis